MSVTFSIPGPLRPYTNGQAQVVVRGNFPTLGAALGALCAAHPGVRDRVLTEEGEVREHVNLFVGNQCVRYGQGLTTPVPDGADISIVPAITGGRTPRGAE